MPCLPKATSNISDVSQRSKTNEEDRFESKYAHIFKKSCGFIKRGPTWLKMARKSEIELFLPSVEMEERLQY